MCSATRLQGTRAELPPTPLTRSRLVQRRVHLQARSIKRAQRAVTRRGCLVQRWLGSNARKCWAKQVRRRMCACHCGRAVCCLSSGKTFWTSIAGPSTRDCER